MAKVIGFYVPTSFQKTAKRTWQRRRAKVIEFCTPTAKSA
jgi:hypothetical protein